MTKAELIRAEKKLLENGITWAEFEEWDTYNHPMDATFEEQINRAIVNIEAKNSELARLLKHVFEHKDFAILAFEGATIKLLREFIFATGIRPHGISKWHKRDYVKQAMNNLNSFFDEKEAKQITVKKPEKKLFRLTKEMKESYDEFYDEIFEKVAKNVEQIKACETREEMQELLETADKEMMSYIFEELNVYGDYIGAPANFSKKEYIETIIRHVFYERNKLREEKKAEKTNKIQAIFHAIRDMKTGAEMREILEPQNDEMIFELAKELDEDIRQGREELIKKIIILTLFGVLPRSERRKKA